MTHPCPSCSDPVADTQVTCPRCGAALESPTGTAPSPRTPAAHAPRTPLPRTPAPPRVGSGSAGISRSPAAASAERFSAGDLLLDRYRIVGLLGKGGMGEVYRADDLVLGQPVALKFLPMLLEGDPERLARFLNEARMAREVSHSAVCRVHDVGEFEGHHFLSMEYVDGEDLSSLVRRIGRLPVGKAADVARQICAGLAAAHARDVLHRDLKPQNVMLDGRGKVRITDFGLAGLADSIQGDEVRSGTPAYMSPEQLAGREVTVRSDIYALGLVLYEIFTGTRAFPGRSAAELKKQHQEPLTPPSELARDVPAETEAAILRCLEADPARRPPSALTVAALLSGGDALAVALAAGETPSPEMVAAAGRQEGIRPAHAWACVAVILLASIAYGLLSRGGDVLSRAPDVKAPEVLADRARGLVRKFAPSPAPADAAHGYGADIDFTRWVVKRPDLGTQWERLATGEPAMLNFWYRQGPRPLAPLRGSDTLSWSDPPVTLSGMVGVQLDPSGRLLAFYRVPPQVERESSAAAEPDWSALFAEARLDPARFKQVPPAWTPPFFSDTRIAWEGTYPLRPEIPLRIEAAAYRGQPASFQLVSPWTRADRMDPFQPGPLETAGDLFVTTLLIGLIVAGALLARHHLKGGRGDRRGAFRLATVVAALQCFAWLLAAHHVKDRDVELGLMARGAGEILLAAFILWLFYLALEPYVRRFWPRTIISWTRLLGGGVRDPLVARDALAGAAWGASLAVVLAVAVLLPEWLGHGTSAPSFKDYDALMGPFYTLAALARFPLHGIRLAVVALLVLLLLKKLLRRERLAAWALAAILTTAQALEQSTRSSLPAWILVPLSALVMGTFTLLLLRFGLLAAVVGVAFANSLLSLPLTTDLQGWSGGPTVLVLLVDGLLVLFAFRSSQGTARSAPSSA